METVIRTLAPPVCDGDALRFFCTEGADDHGDLPVHSCRVAAIRASRR